MKDDPAMLLRIILISVLLVVGCAPVKDQTKVEPIPTVQGVTVNESPYSYKAGVRTGTPVQQPSATGESVLNELAEKEAPPKVTVREPAPKPLRSALPMQLSSRETMQTENGKPISDVVLNFDNADIYEVLNVFSEILGINYIVDPRVKGTVTIRTSGKINREQLMGVFHTILELNGVAAVDKNGFYQIVPLSEVGRRGDVIDAGKPGTKHIITGRGVITIVPLNYVSAVEMARIVKPFLSEGGAVYEFPTLNALVMVDTADNVQRVSEIIASLDVNTFDRIHFRLYSLKNASVEDVGQEFKEAFDSTKLEQSAGGRSIIFNFTPVPRINSILVVSSVPEMFQKVETLLEKLDSAASENVVKVFVYRVQNGKAEDIVSVLQDIYSEGPSQRTSTKRTDLSKTPSSNSRSNSNRTSTTPAATPVSQKSSQGSETTTLTAEVKFVFDETNNSVLVRATPRDYRAILNTIKSLDVYPRQVLIEVLIAEITLDDSTQLGVEWSKLGAQGTGSQLGVLSNLTGDNARITSGLVYTINYTGEFVSALKALASDNKVTVLASPHIIASNNQEAKIDISREVPTITNETTTTSTTNVGVPQTVDRSIQYRDTGIILTVTPHINDQGLVKLELNQEVSNVDTQTISGIDSPIFSKRVATTVLTVQDGQSVVIGGLIRTDKSHIKSGVPVLSQIPALGWLFGYYEEKVSRSELMLLLTPRVIEHIEEADLVTAEFKRKVGSLRKEMENQGKGGSVYLPKPGSSPR